MPPTMDLERNLASFQYIAGVDEAGRGALAGPVMAAAVILPLNCSLAGLDDSKRLTSTQRNKLTSLIQESCLAFAYGWATAVEIDLLNIHEASLLAMTRAVSHLKTDFLLIDGRFTLKNIKLPQKALIKGDQLSSSIAAASILAKTYRDKLMEDLHEKFPFYGFKIHKGYATPVHLKNLAKLGPCSEHRQTYRPVVNAASQQSLFAELSA